MMEALYSQEKIDELREYEAEKRGEKKGKAEGVIEGAMKTMLSLIKRKKISKSDAAEELGISLAEFEKKYKKFAKVAIF